jgi:hypothetical protein
MVPKLSIALSAAVVFFTTLVAAANDNKIPGLDLQKSCRVRANSTVEVMGDKSSANWAFDTCMKSEQEARDTLSAAWNDIPATYKAFCIHPNEYLPSYMEWISCLELGIDLKELHMKSLKLNCAVVWSGMGRC